MADKKISQLTAATTPLAGSEVLPIVQSSTTVKVSVADVTKGRTLQTTGINDNNNNEVITITTTASAVNELTIANAATGANPVISATGTDTNIGITLTPKGTGNAVLTSGNLVVANGNGIDFSAHSHTGGMTSELLTDYEEGTWTPTIGLAAGSPTIVYTNQVGFYTKIGNRVLFSAFITTSTWTHALTTNEFVMSLPIAPSSSPAQIASFNCALNFTKANYTQVTPYITTAFWGSNVIFAANGSGQAFDGILAANVPSGTNIVLVVAGEYAA